MLKELKRFATVPIAICSDHLYTAVGSGQCSVGKQATAKALRQRSVLHLAANRCKLTVPSSTQAQLTTVPKVDGLESDTAAALVKPMNRVVMVICASQQAAKVPPLILQSTISINQRTASVPDCICQGIVK